MIFSSFLFVFIFLPACLLSFAALNRVSRTWGRISLLVFSIIFYASWNWKYLLVLLGLSAFTFVIGKAICGTRQKLLLATGIAAHLLNLGAFKYYGFASSTLHELFGFSIPHLDIILPLGISFFTFQKIAYLIDCYRGKFKGAAFLDFMLFVFFFPQLVAGPIVRPQQLIPQFGKLDVNADRLLFGSALFSIGLFKKAVLADSIATVADPLFAAVQGGVILDVGDAWAAALAFGYQIYFDFSGYSDMALGLAILVGVTLPINFYRRTNL